MKYFGVVENRTDDPLKLGRCKVRVFGLHSADKVELPTSDLPWAIVMQPVTSSAVSGIGQSPTGIVEGAYVVIDFLDDHQQQPIIIGTIAGIPTPFKDQTVQIVETSESINTRNPDNYTSSDAVNTTVASVIKKPTDVLVPSEECFDFIKDEEKLSSILKGSNKYVSSKLAKTLKENDKIYSYQDTKGVWTIGWGNTFLKDGSSVKSDTVITKAEADELLSYTVNKTFTPGIRRSLKVPVTQSMFDALVSIAYNSGVTGVNTSAFYSALNNLDYEGAANLITVFKTNNGSLSARRLREKTFFSKDGFPNNDMSGVSDTPALKEKQVNDATQNPVVEVKQPETITTTTRKVEGFRDPNGVYPTIVNEPDTHRLARHEKIDQTIVFAKEAARAKEVITGGDKTWDQPPIPYNASYPYNHVRVTESGHVQEFDDTKGNERVHTYHRSGTFQEVDKNGTRVNRIVGDDFEIIERNGHVLVRGTLNLTVIGNNNIRIENDANIDVLGDVTLTVGGDMSTGVNGDYRIAVNGEFSVDAIRIDWNSRKGDNVIMGKGTASGEPEFSKLDVPSRHNEIVGEYETPEDGDPTEYNKTLEEAGINEAVKSSNPVVNTPQVSKADPVIDNKVADPLPKDCSMIPNDGTIDPSFQLSPNFKLSQMHETVKRLASPPVVNLTKAAIVCNIKMLAENCLEPIKKVYPGLFFTSVYRNNIPPGGSKNSDHLYGCAADIQIKGFSREQHFIAIQEIAKILPAWTQLILEYRGDSTWIHISYNPAKKLKMEKFTMNNDKRISDFGKFVLV